jgi:hypothetical protein
VKKLVRMLTTITGLSIIAIGFGVPVASIYFSVYHGFNWLIAGIIGFFALIVAGVLGVVGMAISTEEIPEGISTSEREKLTMMRAYQRATLEELDDIIVILKEIRDILKAAEQ